MFKFLKKVAFLILGALAVISGAFVAIAGVVGGFGALSISFRITYALAGIAVFIIGLYLYKLGSNKSILNVIGKVIDVLISSI